MEIQAGILEYLPPSVEFIEEIREKGQKECKLSLGDNKDPVIFLMGYALAKGYKIWSVKVGGNWNVIITFQ